MAGIPEEITNIGFHVRSCIDAHPEIKMVTYAILRFGSLDDHLATRGILKKILDPRCYNNGLQPNEIVLNRRGIEEYMGLREGAEYNCTTLTIDIPSRFELFLKFYAQTLKK